MPASGIKNKKRNRRWSGKKKTNATIRQKMRKPAIWPKSAHGCSKIPAGPEEKGWVDRGKINERRNQRKRGALAVKG